MLARVARSTVSRQFAARAAFRPITSEAFQRIADSETKWQADALSRANVQAPTQAQIEASEKLVEAMRTAMERPAKIRMVAVMDAAIAAENLDYAFLAVQEINKRGYQQDPTTLKRLVEACTAAGEMDRAYQLVDSFINFGCLPDTQALAMLVEGYVKAGRPLDAVHIMDSWKNVEDAEKPDPAMIKRLSDALSGAGFAAEAKAMQAMA